jgi:hypothetical protein
LYYGGRGEENDKHPAVPAHLSKSHDDPEAEVPAVIVGGAVEADGGAALVGALAPGTAAADAETPVAFILIGVQTPFPDVAVHGLRNVLPSSRTPLRQLRPKIDKTRIFLEESDPFRHFYWRAEGGGATEIRLTSALFWPSANS